MSEETIETDVQEETESNENEFEQYPTDHPLVKTLAAQKAELKELRKTNSATTRELDEIRKASLTEQERIVENVRSETRQSVQMEFAGRLVEAELKSALSNRVLVADALISFDKKQFIDENGDIDTEAISAWVDAHTKPADAPLPNLGQGIRGKTISGSTMIRSRDDLANMSNAEILAARKDGRLDSLMGKN